LSRKFYPDSVAKGDTLFFEVEIWNSLGEIVVGNYWLSVRLPSSNEILIPEGMLNYPNPFSGQIQANSTVNLSNELYVPVGASTATFAIVGRVGLYPNVVIDEEEFELHVIE